jgi:hypothetical protein
VPRLDPLEDRLVPALFTVNSPAEGPVDLTDSTVTLRDAIYAANNDVQVSPGGPVGTGNDEIQFATGLNGPITLNQGELDISSNLTITGPGANVLTVNGTPASRVFTVFNGSTTSLTGLTIANGSRGFGGAIFNAGTLTLNNCALNNNSGSSGGAIYNQGLLTISNSTLSGNSAGFEAGGIENAGILTVSNSTLFGNSAFQGGCIVNRETLSVSDCTFSANSASFRVGGIDNLATATLNNTIVANSPSVDDVENLGTLTGSHNLIETGGGLDGLTGTITADPLLGALANNGGSTQTLALLTGSPAIDAGDNTLVPAGVMFDQRGLGFARIVGAAVDIGAFEVQNQAPTITVPGPQTAYENVDQAISGLSVGDPASSNLTVTVQVSNGTLTLGTTTGLSVSGNGSGSVILAGSIADLDAALASLVYVGAQNFGGDDTLNITASDGNLSTSASVAIHVQSRFEQATNLQAQVQALQDAGVLNQGQANSLIVKLHLHGNNGDHGKVQAFLNEVNALLQAGILTQAQADALLGPGRILLLSVIQG